MDGDVARSGPPRFDKLDEDYRTWSTYCKAYLKNRGVWAVIESPRPARPAPLLGADPATTLAADRQADKDGQLWDRRNEVALSDIQLGVKPHLLHLVEDCATAAEAWLALKVMFEDDTTSRRADLELELSSLTMSSGETVVKYTGRAKTLRNALSTAGVQVDDHSLVLHILRGLPAGYAMIKTVLENFPGTLSLAQTTARLLNVEKQIQAGNGGAGAPAGQAFSAAGSQAKKDQDKTEKRKCFYCGKVGHIKRRCLKRKADLKKGGSEDKDERKLAFAVAGGAAEDDDQPPDPSVDEWLVDSGATHHMATGRGDFKTLGGGNMSAVTLASGDKAAVTGRGCAEVPVHDGEQVTTITLSEVYRVPALQQNLLSVGKIDAAGGAVLFVEEMCLVFQSSRAVLESGIMAKAGAVGYKDSRGQYIIGGAKNPVAEAKVASMPVTGTAVLLHRRFFHLGYENLRRVAGMVDGMNKKDVTGESVAGAICRPCAEGKLSRAPFPTSTTKTPRMELLHSDMCGPFPRSVGGSTYFATLFEPATGLLLATPMKAKGDVGTMIRARIPLLERLCGDKAKRLRTDGAKEYATRSLLEWYNEKGIDLEQTLPYTPESNGVAERVNRTIKERHGPRWPTPTQGTSCGPRRLPPQCSSSTGHQGRART